MDRRIFLARTGTALLGSLGCGASASDGPPAIPAAEKPGTSAKPAQRSAIDAGGVTLFLCGDVMTGRGIDQILRHPSKPHLYESYVRTALGYVELAEQAYGPIARPAEDAYIWGDALDALERMRPQARIVNLETAVTAAEDAWPRKGIHYRMHPANVGCLTAAHIDCCTLANNHVLDWGHRGLGETLETLHAAGIRTAGAGHNAAEAAAPAVIDLPNRRRVLVFSMASVSSGVPVAWAAGSRSAGVNLLADLSSETVAEVAGRVAAARRTGDVVVASIHWGSNWGYDIPSAHRDFAHALIDAAAVDVVHGHSSHHPLGIEVHRDKAILYGCGDFLNDYEGIGGYEHFRTDLALMYLPAFDAAARLSGFTINAMQIRHFQLHRAREEDILWLEARLSRESARLGTRVERQPDNTLAVRWGGH
jgi:poly-gamma-glutamate synthesis protein (capsule biosynthesis protein)